MKYFSPVYFLIIFSFFIGFANPISADGGNNRSLPIVSCANESGKVGELNYCRTNIDQPCRVEYWDSLDQKCSSQCVSVTSNISTSELDQCLIWIQATLKENERIYNPECYFQGELIDCHQSPTPKKKAKAPVYHKPNFSTNSPPKLLSWIDKLLSFYN